MSEELSPEEIGALVASLHKKAGELRAALVGLDEAAKVVDLDQPIGRLSRMDAIQQQQMSAANKATAERTLQQIDAALRAVEAGDYGFCRRCDEPIGVRRLTARPETPLCLACQSAAERG